MTVATDTYSLNRPPTTFSGKKIKVRDRTVPRTPRQEKVLVPDLSGNGLRRASSIFGPKLLRKSVTRPPSPTAPYKLKDDHVVDAFGKKVCTKPQSPKRKARSRPVTPVKKVAPKRTVPAKKTEQFCSEDRPLSPGGYTIHFPEHYLRVKKTAEQQEPSIRSESPYAEERRAESHYRDMRPESPCREPSLRPESPCREPSLRPESPYRESLRAESPYRSVSPLREPSPKEIYRRPSPRQRSPSVSSSRQDSTLRGRYFSPPRKAVSTISERSSSPGGYRIALPEEYAEKIISRETSPVTKPFRRQETDEYIEEVYETSSKQFRRQETVPSSPCSIHRSPSGTPYMRKHSPCARLSRHSSYSPSRITSPREQPIIQLFPPTPMKKTQRESSSEDDYFKDTLKPEKYTKISSPIRRKRVIPENRSDLSASFVVLQDNGEINNNKVKRNEDKEQRWMPSWHDRPRK